jgi:hypothetical protein
MSELAGILSSWGCTDAAELPLLADPSLPLSEQAADLKRRFPAAFPRHARDMTPEQYKTAVKEATKYRPEPVQVITKHASQMSDGEFTRALRQFHFYRRTPR